MGMLESAAAGVSDPISASMYGMDASDPRSQLIDRSGLSRDDIEQIGRLMAALATLRRAEQAVSEASEQYMKLSAQDMRVIHFLMVAKNKGQVATPGMIASFLSISPASTTKLLNRLEQAGHLVRRVHPHDRRAYAIEVTAHTEVSARQTVGKQQARRVHAAARLTPDQRETVTSFLLDMAGELSMDHADWAEPSGQ